MKNNDKEAGEIPTWKNKIDTCEDCDRYMNEGIGSATCSMNNDLVPLNDFDICKYFRKRR